MPPRPARPGPPPPSCWTSAPDAGAPPPRLSPVASTFYGLNIASSGLSAHQTAMSVLGHNIANANNPTYKRQQAVMAARPGQPSHGGAVDPSAGRLGSGTQILAIRRMQDNYLDSQVRASGQSLGYWQAGRQALDQVVGIIGEPSEYALGSQLDKFWNAWQELSLNPENLAARNSVLETGGSVARSLNRIASQIEGVRTQTDLAIRDRVTSINSLTGQLASVNDEIQRTVGAGHAPNDLMDQRDAILSELSQLVDIQVYGTGGSTDVVTIGGRALLQGNRASQLTTGEDADGHATVVWAEDGAPVEIAGGELGGQMHVQNVLIPNYLQALDDVAAALIARVNDLHAGGYGLDGGTGRGFFDGAGARDIRLSSAVADNPRALAASASGAPGDAGVALSIARVKSEALVGGGTIGEGYRGFVSRTASDASTFEGHTKAQTRLHEQMTLQQQSISGVSLDEELAEMIRYQKAYTASARVLTAMDEMLGILVERLGVVGR